MIATRRRARFRQEQQFPVVVDEFGQAVQKGAQPVVSRRGPVLAEPRERLLEAGLVVLDQRVDEPCPVVEAPIDRADPDPGLPGHRVQGQVGEAVGGE